MRTRLRRPSFVALVWALAGCGGGLLGTVNEPPLADAGGDRAGLIGAEISFTASGSSDPDGTLVAWSWEFGDGTGADGETAAHAYATVGVYTVRLVVTDDRGATAESSAKVTIGTDNVSPVAEAGGDRAGHVGVEMTFDGSGSSDPDGTIASWRWEFGDGTGAEGEAAVHTWAAVGAYTVRLVVTDDEGATAESTAAVTITDPGMAPLALVEGPNAARVGDTVPLDGSGSTDEDGTIVSWRWAFPGGVVKTGAVVSHVFPAAGLQTVTLTVTDDDGLTGTWEHVVRVSPRQVVQPSSSRWRWDLVNAGDRSDANCGPFQSADLLIEISGPDIVITEGGGAGGSTVYRGTISGRSFSATHNLTGGTDTIAATFAEDYLTFDGTYHVEVSILSCNRTRAVRGTRL